MKKYKLNYKILLQIIITLIFLFGISGCQADEGDVSPGKPTSQTSGSTPEKQSTSETNNKGNGSSEGETKPEVETDPDVISSQWSESAHGNTYVIDNEGKNNACAQCHAPLDWAPTMEDIPPSCFTCKFELSEPPVMIAESDWQSIPCKVCHQVDKKGNVKEEISWLEVAVLDEYTDVENSTELCLKCHAPTNLVEHVAIEVAGAHADYLCTDCHDNHTLTTSCGESTCHEGMQDPNKVIIGHDEEHKNVSCEACHDAAGLEVGPDEETGIWITYAPWTAGDQTGLIPFVSHNTILEVNCERCHFAGNPWELTVDIETP
jgi:hypothetical protein